MEKIVGYAKEIRVFYEREGKAPSWKYESFYREASGKKLLDILCALDANALKEIPEVEMVVIMAEYIPVTKFFE